MNLTEHELEMVIDALQFTSCCDVSSNISEERQQDMGRLSTKLAKDNDYVSKDNYYHPKLIKDQPDNLDIIKEHLSSKE